MPDGEPEPQSSEDQLAEAIADLIRHIKTTKISADQWPPAYYAADAQLNSLIRKVLRNLESQEAAE